MAHDQPSFSIIIPTCQRCALVCEAVGAISQIEYAGEIELIVVVDGSTDGTAIALEALEVPFPRTIIVQANAGLAAARKDILLFLDDDMICQPDIVQHHALSYAAGADAVVGEIPLEAGSPGGFLTQAIAQWAESSAAEARARLVLTPFNIYGGHISVRAEVFDELGGFELGRADVRFLRRYPEFAHVLLRRNGASRRTTQLILRPLAAVPVLPHLLTGLAAVLSPLVLRSPLRPSPLFARYFHTVRQIAYWAGIHASGGASAADL